MNKTRRDKQILGDNKQLIETTEPINLVSNLRQTEAQ